MQTGSASLPEGLSAAEVEIMRSVEDDLWWYRALRGRVLDCLAGLPPHFPLLDAGCGGGGMLARIRGRYPSAQLTGLDISERALELTGERGLNAQLVRGKVDELPFDDGEFDAVLSLDVIVMRGVDDAAAIRELHRVLVPGGRCIINVAAFDFLRGSHDAATNMARRYTRDRLSALLLAAGFQIEQLTYWNMLLFPAIAVVRWMSRSRAHNAEVRSDLAPVWRPLNALLTATAKSEMAINRYLALPFGTSLFAVARK